MNSESETFPKRVLQAHVISLLGYIKLEKITIILCKYFSKKRKKRKGRRWHDPNTKPWQRHTRDKIRMNIPQIHIQIFFKYRKLYLQIM